MLKSLESNRRWVAEDGFPFQETLLGSDIDVFISQHSEHLAISKHKLVFIYTILLVNIRKP